MGVCCIVFDIDGMLFDFFMNFLNNNFKICFSFNSVTVTLYVMGVCCIVFDIDGMLFDFFMNFLNNNFKIFFLSIFHVFFAFYAISNI